jgi:hypothetical protein
MSTQGQRDGIAFVPELRFAEERQLRTLLCQPDHRKTPWLDPAPVTTLVFCQRGCCHVLRHRSIGHKGYQTSQSDVLEGLGNV